MINCLVTCVGSAPAIGVVKALHQYKKLYHVIGYDCDPLSPGQFYTDEFVLAPKVTNNHHFTPFIQDLITNKNIHYVFVTHQCELEWWAKNKHLFPKQITIFHDDWDIVDICLDKMKTWKFAHSHGLKVPPLYQSNQNENKQTKWVKRLRKGSGSIGMEISNNPTNIDQEIQIVTKFIQGQEYTVDVVADVNQIHPRIIVPKQRLQIKGGAAIKSQTKYNQKVIDYVQTLCKLLNHKYALNVQVIQETNTGDVYLVEINPKWATSMTLTTQAGVNMPDILIRGIQQTDKIWKNNITLIRHFHEHFIYPENNNQENKHTQQLAPTSNASYDRLVWGKCLLRDNLIPGCSRMNAILPVAKTILNGLTKGVDYGYGDNEAYHGQVEHIFPGAIGIDQGVVKYPNGITIRNKQFHHLNFPPDCHHLDYIISSHALEHIPEWHQTLIYWISKLAQQGILFLYLPHESVAAWRPENTPHHVHKHTLEELKYILTDMGMKIIECLHGCDSEGSFYIVAQKCRHS